MVAFYADYDAQCEREGVVDFAELLLRTYELLSRNLNILQHYQARFRYILVDEFQDTNKLQYKWIKMLAGTNGCVGPGITSTSQSEGTPLSEMRFTVLSVYDSFLSPCSAEL